MDEVYRIPEAIKELFPDNYPYHFENAHVNRLYLMSAFVLISGQDYIGTAALYDNPGHFLEGERTCALGYFNCIDSAEASQILMDAIKEEAQKLGRKYIVGPLNGSTWESYRLRNTDIPGGFFLESATPPYYNKLFSNNGFKPIREYQSFLLPSIEAFIQSQSKDVELKSFEDITFRYVNPDRYESELRAIHELSLESFKDNFLFTPYPWESFIEKYKLLESVASPDMTLLAEHKGEVIAYIFMIPDFLDPSGKRCILKTYCVHPDYQSKGLSTYMTGYFLGQMLEKGYESCIIAYVIVDGVSQHMFDEHSEVYREYTLYAYAFE